MVCMRSDMLLSVCQVFLIALCRAAVRQGRVVATSMLSLPGWNELVFVWAPCSAISLPLKLVRNSLLLWPRLWSPVGRAKFRKANPEQGVIDTLARELQMCTCKPTEPIMVSIRSSLKCGMHVDAARDVSKDPGKP